MTADLDTRLRQEIDSWDDGGYAATVLTRPLLALLDLHRTEDVIYVDADRVERTGTMCDECADEWPCTTVQVIAECLGRGVC